MIIVTIENNMNDKYQPRGQDLKIFTRVDVCPYSKQLLQLAHERQIKFANHDLSNDSPPSWLPGTPTVVDNRDVYCGDAAFSFIESISISKDSEDLKKIQNPVRDGIGCGLSQAFMPPTKEEVNESDFNVSTDDMVARVLAGRR